MGAGVSAEPGIVSVSEGDFTVTTNTGTAEEVTESLRQQEAPAEPEKDDEKPDLSKAASELGKKGGEAAARARKAAEAKKEPAEKPEAKPAEEPDEAESEKRKLADDIAKEPDPEKKKQLASERVAEATRRAAAKVREAEARAAKIEAEAQTLRARLEAAERGAQSGTGDARNGAATGKGPSAAPSFDESDPEPQQGDFEDYAEYIKAVSAHTYRAEHRKVQREQGARQFADSAVQHFDSFRSRVNEAVKDGSHKLDDLIPFEEVVSNCSYVQPPGQALTAFNVINDELLGARQPAALMAFLKGKPEAMRYLLGLPSRDAITREMARIEGALARSSQRSEGATTGTPPTEREVSRAEPPVTPVAGSPSVASPAPRNGESDDEWFRRNYLKR